MKFRRLTRQSRVVDAVLMSDIFWVPESQEKRRDSLHQRVMALHELDDVALLPTTTCARTDASEVRLERTHV